MKSRSGCWPKATPIVTGKPGLGPITHLIEPPALNGLCHQRAQAAIEGQPDTLPPTPNPKLQNPEARGVISWEESPQSWLEFGIMPRLLALELENEGRRLEENPDINPY